MSMINLWTLPGLGSKGPMDYETLKNQMLQSFSPTEFPNSAGALTGEGQTPGVGGAFTDFLDKAIDSVNRQESYSAQLAQDLAVGKPVELHTVQIEGAKAEIMVHLASSVTNKVAQSFQTLMNTQI